MTLRNSGAAATRFLLNGEIRTGVYSPALGMVGTRPGPADVLLEANEEHEGYWEVARTLDDWISIYDQRASGEPGVEAVLSASVEDGHETGATYTFTLTMGGCAIEPTAPGLRETWKISEPCFRVVDSVGRAITLLDQDGRRLLGMHENGAPVGTH